MVDILKSKAWLRRAVWSVLAVLVLWALGWLAVPPLLRSQGQKLAGEALGRDVRIGRIEFAPWSLQLTVHDVAVATADGQGTQFTVTRVLADVGMASLLRLAPVLDALEVDQPVLHLASLLQPWFLRIAPHRTMSAALEERPLSRSSPCRRMRCWLRYPWR